jgi:hypothetical protein
VRDAPRPVLVCKGPPRALDATTVVLDGSYHARHALEWLTSALALPSSTRLRLLGVAEAYHYPSSTSSTWSAWGESYPQGRTTCPTRGRAVRGGPGPLRAVACDRDGCAHR